VLKRFEFPTNHRRHGEKENIPPQPGGIWLSFLGSRTSPPTVPEIGLLPSSLESETKSESQDSGRCGFGWSFLYAQSH
jgi:hypothetical protein